MLKEAPCRTALLRWSKEPTLSSVMVKWETPRVQRRMANLMTLPDDDEQLAMGQLHRTCLTWPRSVMMHQFKLSALFAASSCFSLPNPVQGLESRSFSPSLDSARRAMWLMTSSMDLGLG